MSCFANIRLLLSFFRITTTSVIHRVSTAFGKLILYADLSIMKKDFLTWLNSVDTSDQSKRLPLRYAPFQPLALPFVPIWNFIQLFLIFFTPNIDKKPKT